MKRTQADQGKIRAASNSQDREARAPMPGTPPGLRRNVESVAERWSDMGEGYWGVWGGQIPVTAAAGDAKTYLDT